MKKKLLALGLTALLAGCSMYTVEEESSTNEEQSGQGESGGEETDNAEIKFSLQNSDRIVQVSPTNDEALNMLSDMVYEAEDAVGEEGEITVDYSGVYLNAGESSYGVFLITNRTDEPVTNISLNLTVEGTDGTSLLDNYPVYLAMEHFGVLEADSAMPLYVELDAPEDVLTQTAQEDATETTVNGITHEHPTDVEEDQAADQKEGFNPGYHPSYTLSIQGQQQMQEDIESGNVPQLELLSPPVIMNQPGENPLTLMDEQLLNTARATMPEGDFGLFWTGLTQVNEESGAMTTMFLLGNRTGEDLANVEVDMDFTDTAGNSYVEDTVNLPQEEYGTLNDQSLMPFFVEIPGSLTDSFQTLLEGGEQPEYSVVDVNGDA